VGEGDRVLEVGAGLGSLTVALAETGAEVLAVEFDRALVPALEEAIASFANVRVEVADALRLDVRSLLAGGEWSMVSNLPYNVAVPLLVRMLDGVPQIRSYLVMVQREVGERLASAPGGPAYGAVSARVAYLADAEVLRRVPPTVFWPEPKVDSVLLRLTPRTPPVDCDRAALFRVIEEGFGQRRKTMGNALRRLGLDARGAARVLEECGLRPDARAEQLGLPEFARLAGALLHEGVLEEAGR